MSSHIAKMIDHTLLKPDATKEEIDKICAEAKTHAFASVCVQPSWVKYCYDQLRETSVKVCTVIGFPLGATTTATKVFETSEAVENGATEVDMVINIGALKDNNNSVVEKDIRAVVAAANERALTKVIIETSLLSDKEIVRACELAVQAGADFVKTSTGFSIGGATEAHIKLMRQTVGPDIGVKASGGVRSAEDAQRMVAAGATRIGASSGVAIITDTASDATY